MKIAVLYLKNGSIIDGEEVFLVTASGFYFSELYSQFHTLKVVPRGNLKQPLDVYLCQIGSRLISAYVFLSEEEAFLYRIKH